MGSSSVSPLQSPKLQDMSPKNSYRENLGQGRISKIGMGRYAGHHGNLNSQSKSFSRNSQASNFETNRYSVHVRILVEVRIGGNIERPASLPRSLDLEISLLVLIFDVVHLCLVWRVAFHETPAEKIKNCGQFIGRPQTFVELQLRFKLHFLSVTRSGPKIPAAGKLEGEISWGLWLHYTGP